MGNPLRPICAHFCRLIFQLKVVWFTCSPIQKAMMNLCMAIAKHKYQTMEAFFPRPIAMPSKTACNEMANMIKKPLIATWNEAFLIFAKTSVDCGFFGAHARIVAHFNSRPHTHCTENSPCCPVNYDREICILLYNILIQRVLNRWSKLSEQKLRFFSKVKI